ncbi:putative hydroxyacid-oxoacid transhydrogenase mitochondrial [Ceratocystis platani]|uniref:alcohol dehydrogenase n=1 Tax=Ceratocystis fimbriata f. sp. platani TaxID=88771 RepID=A0A0F8DNS3_CERFI|nr:putative hydroxyacid-oxoacid transhydrogenase mitochondrial [Ceratocystis platani]
MAASSIRFGEGVTREVGMDLKNMKAKNVCVVTDPTVDSLLPMQHVRESLDQEGITYTVFNRVKIEPKDYSVMEAIEWARPLNADVYVAVGGGSVIDTAKLMNLYSVYSEAPLSDFIAAPSGAGRPIDRPLRPLIAIPTTAGTGSETTGTAIFDLTAQRAKTGVAHRNLKPLLGICDPLNTRSMPAAAAEAFGVDVSNAAKSSAGEILGDAIREFLYKLGDQPTGLKALGFKDGDIDQLVEGTLPQGRVLKLAPGLKMEEQEEEKEQLRRLFEDSM